MRAEAFPVGLGGDNRAVIGGAAEENPGAEPVTRLEDVVHQHPAPFCAEIELVGVMAAVDLGTEGRPRLYEPAQIGGGARGPGGGPWGRQDPLGVGNDAMFLSAPETGGVAPRPQLGFPG